MGHGAKSIFFGRTSMFINKKYLIRNGGKGFFLELYICVASY